MWHNMDDEYTFYYGLTESKKGLEIILNRLIINDVKTKPNCLNPSGHYNIKEKPQRLSG